MRVETRAADVGHVAALAEVGLLIGDHPHVLQERTACGDRLHGIAVTTRKAERPHPVVARADRHDGEQHLVGPHLALDEEPVDHLVQRAVAPHYDDATVTLLHGRNGQFRGVELMLGEDRLAEDMRLAHQPRNERKVVEPAAASGHGIDDDEPLFGFRFHASGHFTGTLRSVWTRKS